LKCETAVIDGEVVMLDGQGGLPVFVRLRYGPRERPDALLYAFDLLELDGEDLRGEPIEDRKAALERLLSRRVAPRKGQPDPEGDPLRRAPRPW
jgi:bifunctional non-homologous end joining protein LigD